MVRTKDTDAENTGNPQVRLCEIVRASGSCGFNLTKSKWDPYPWVSNVESGSPAESVGVQAGDCLLEVNGEDVLGLRVFEVASKVKARDERVTVMLWNSGVDPKCSPETLCCGPMPTNLQRLSACMSIILSALECPICLDTIPPPAHQCANGHLICIKCRVNTEKCPICRIKIFRGRSLLADQVYNSLIDAFDLRDKEESKRREILKQRLFGHKSLSLKSMKPEIKFNILPSPRNKILSKLIRSGKSSSVENLSHASNLEKNTNLLDPMDNFHSGLRIKSLSSSEIFNTDNQAVSRSNSVLLNKPGSGLLDVQTVIHSKQSASYHGSVEDLQLRLLTDFECNSIHQVNQTCFCPCDPACEKQFKTTYLFKHIQEYHEGPILHFFKPKIEFVIPLVYEKTTIITIFSYHTCFIIKILDYSFNGKTNHVWVWSTNNTHTYTVDVTLQGSNFKNTSQCPVISLETTSWQKIFDENHGILLNTSMPCAKLEIEIFQNF